MNEIKTIPKAKESVRDLISQKPISDHLQELKRELPETYEHAARVAILATALGMMNDLPEDKLRILGSAGLLHDIGKLDIDDDILHTPGELTDKQQEEIKKHPRYSFRRLQDDYFERIRKIVVAHHEHQTDPYPRKETQESDDLVLKQILAVADMFDALASERSYKEAMSISQVEDVMREEFTGKDALIDQILQLKEDYRTLSVSL